MKKSLAHLPQLKQDELELIAMMIRSLCEDVHMVVLFGSYARGDLAADYCPQLASILPRDTDKEKEFFGLLDYAYIGARYDINYKITKQQLEQLAPCVKRLHKVTERRCKQKIKSFV